MGVMALIIVITISIACCKKKIEPDKQPLVQSASPGRGKQERKEKSKNITGHNNAKPEQARQEKRQKVQTEHAAQQNIASPGHGGKKAQTLPTRQEEKQRMNERQTQEKIDRSMYCFSNYQLHLKI